MNIFFSLQVYLPFSIADTLTINTSLIHLIYIDLCLKQKIFLKITYWNILKSTGSLNSVGHSVHDGEEKIRQLFRMSSDWGLEPFYTLEISWSCGKVITLIYKNSLMNSWIMGISIHFKIFTYLLSLRSENILEAIESMNCEIYKYKPIRGGSFIPTPPKYARKKAIINIHNTKDNFCLLYSCIAKIRSVKIVSIISHDYEHHQ